MLVILGCLVVKEGDRGERVCLGSRMIHCEVCSHPQLNWTCGLESVILFQGCENKFVMAGDG